MSGRRLLVLDDEAVICDLISSTAVSLGYEVEMATDGRHLQPDHFERFDIVVLDLMMPSIDGIEIIRRIAEAGRKPDLILTSGLDIRMLNAARSVAAAKQLRVIDVLKKPFRPKDLAWVLDKCEAQTRTGMRPPPKPVQQFVEADIEKAIRESQFVVHYQPQILLANGGWVGVEALVRWQHPDLGLLYPGAFVAVAESPPVALAFTDAIIRRALSDIAPLLKSGFFDGTVSVNLPPAALTDLGYPDVLLSALKEQQISPDRLTLEITETSIPANLGVSLDIETRLRMRGVRLAIDDFGTGHSSLERVHETPFDELKVDMRFIQSLDRDPTARAIVQNAVSLAHSLNMQVVAEGVESEDPIRFLRDIGCEVAQGYYFSKPLPIEQLQNWAKSARKK